MRSLGPLVCCPLVSLDRAAALLAFGAGAAVVTAAFATEASTPAAPTAIAAVGLAFAAVLAVRTIAAAFGRTGVVTRIALLVGLATTVFALESATATDRVMARARVERMVLSFIKLTSIR